MNQMTTTSTVAPSATLEPKKMKVLNLYAGIGGNRAQWNDDWYEVTAVEYDPQIAAIYAAHFPNDEVVVGDAHEYLRMNFEKFDFIWTSPPCQTHSKFRRNMTYLHPGRPQYDRPEYPKMELYEEIVFLMHNFDGLWSVENVVPYYEPLIEPTFKIERHLYWANFDVVPETFVQPKGVWGGKGSNYANMAAHYGLDVRGHKYDGDKMLLYRNCVNPSEGAYILDAARQVWLDK